MCREFGKIDQNFCIKLLTNMDQYAAIYVRIVLLTLRLRYDTPDYTYIIK